MEQYGALWIPLLSAGLCPLLVLVLVKKLLQNKSNKLSEQNTISISQGELQKKRINTRFFLAINSVTLLLGLSFFLLPFVSVFASPERHKNEETLLFSVFGLIMVSVVVSLALFLGVKRGDLNWIFSFQKKKTLKSEHL